ncbi:hypothetical protein GCM10007079_42790 [Nocardiopsis terrae]|uniref:Uncharacterized protein n=1 Tax=Nocardiopsis terrae TaxID=372655 RepID=A0ABR9HLM5_9ACTN|nr:hypothetical protein [Nocardiopsis terrae]MBE1459905.1 hypothetical protein [Nocardiopsis terrae]GHC93416.1 hypothetical protein GCM10007079_42790 [Nocardiopsis terrae]
MPEPTASPVPGSDEPAAPAADETTAPRTPFSWPARVALVASVGLVVGGAAFTATEVAAALSPPSPAPSVAEDEEEGPSERRTTPLTGTAGSEEPRDTEGAEGEQAAEHAADPPKQASGEQGPGGSTPPETGGGAPGALSEGDPGWVDPREEILEEMLNTPQERPPMEPQITQEELDALREAEEADAVVQVPEPDYSEFLEVAPDAR